MALWTLWAVFLAEYAAVFAFHRHAVDLNNTIDDLNFVTWQTDQAFDEVIARHRVAKHHHISALWFATDEALVASFAHPTTKVLGIHIHANGRNTHRRTRRIRIAICHLVHEEEVTNEQRVFHRTGRDPEWLKEQGTKHTGNEERPEDRFDGFDDAVVAFGFFRHRVCLRSIYSRFWSEITCGRARVLSTRLAGLFCDWTGFDHDKGLRPWVIIRQRHMDDRLVTGWCHCFQALLGPARNLHDRLTGT
mmetsp:Transcript_90/g.225  ORF Transcript_90/g.225 Transcript_90/m.225 type:complete len:248 (+) Transcript_90:4294-5037(+)